MGQDGTVGAGPTAKDPVAVAIGHRVEEERKARGLTREELGIAAGIDGRHVWRVEAARGNVQARSLMSLAKGLGLTLSELLAGVEELVAKPPDKPASKRRGPRPKGWRDPDDAGTEHGASNGANTTRTPAPAVTTKRRPRVKKAVQE